MNYSCFYRNMLKKKSLRAVGMSCNVFLRRFSSNSVYALMALSSTHFRGSKLWNLTL